MPSPRGRRPSFSERMTLQIREQAFKFWFGSVSAEVVAGILVYMAITHQLSWLKALVSAIILVALGAAMIRFLVAPQPLHEARVSLVHPQGEDSYYMTSCECGWISVPHSSELDARAAAHTHTSRVLEGVEDLRG